jgi:hypothetical protein
MVRVILLISLQTVNPSAFSCKPHPALNFLVISA